jgi:hypothetical protein
MSREISLEPFGKLLLRLAVSLLPILFYCESVGPAEYSRAGSYETLGTLCATTAREQTVPA